MPSEGRRVELYQPVPNRCGNTQDAPRVRVARPLLYRTRVASFRIPSCSLRTCRGGRCIRLTEDFGERALASPRVEVVRIVWARDISAAAQADLLLPNQFRL